MSQIIELHVYKGRATGHGFRHTMSTIMHEQGFDSAWIEMQLAQWIRTASVEHITKHSI